MLEKSLIDLFVNTQHCYQKKNVQQILKLRFRIFFNPVAIETRTATFFDFLDLFISLCLMSARNVRRILHLVPNESIRPGSTGRA